MPVQPEACSNYDTKTQSAPSHYLDFGVYNGVVQDSLLCLMLIGECISWMGIFRLHSLSISPCWYPGHYDRISSLLLMPEDTIMNPRSSFCFPGLIVWLQLFVPPFKRWLSSYAYWTGPLSPQGPFGKRHFQLFFLIILWLMAFYSLQPIRIPIDVQLSIPWGATLFIQAFVYFTHPFRLWSDIITFYSSIGGTWWSESQWFFRVIDTRIAGPWASWVDILTVVKHVLPMMIYHIVWPLPIASTGDYSQRKSCLLSMQLHSAVIIDWIYRNGDSSLYKTKIYYPSPGQFNVCLS